MSGSDTSSRESSTHAQRRNGILVSADHKDKQPSYQRGKHNQSTRRLKKDAQEGSAGDRNLAGRRAHSFSFEEPAAPMLLACELTPESQPLSTGGLGGLLVVMGSDLNKRDGNWQGVSAFDVARSSGCAISQRQTCRHDINLDPQSELAMDREFAKAKLDDMPALQINGYFFAFHKKEHSIAIGIAGNKPSRIAMVQLATILLCASNGTLNADSLMENMMPSRLANMIYTFVHYLCLPGCGTEMRPRS